MTIKQIEKVKTPKFIQQIESTLKPLEFLDRCAKNYGDIFFTNSFGNLETLVVSHPQDIQELFNPTNKIIDAPGAANEIFKPHLGENSLIIQDGERHQKQRKLIIPPFHGEQNYPNYRVLLIADQFEELYTLCGDEKTRRSFLDTLLAATQTFSSKSKLFHVLVATMRADFLGYVLSYRPLADVVRADIKLATMNRSELLQVIEKPALKLGVTFQDGLVERILDDVDSEPGNLPLLEFALTQLWKQRTGKQLTHTAYEEIGEVSSALTRHASDNYSKLSVT